MQPVLCFDEAHLLHQELVAAKPDSSDTRSAYEILMRWIVRNTKEERNFHVLMVSSAPRFASELYKHPQAQVKPLVLGDLDKADASQFWKRCGGEKVKFDDAFAAVGGHMHHLESLAEAPDYDFELQSIQASLNYVATDFLTKHGKHAVLAIEFILSNGGMVPKRELLQKLQENGYPLLKEAAEKLEEMIDDNGFQERIVQGLSSDLPAAARDMELPIVMAPCRAVRKLWEVNLESWKTLVE